MADLQTTHSSPETFRDHGLSVRVEPFTEGDSTRWDCFVQAQRGGSFFHQVGWKRVMEETFGYRSCYLFAERGGRITGVLPVFSVSNWIIGRCLISVPFGVYGGICADDPESEQALLAELKQRALAEQVDYLELRHRNGGLLPDFHPNQRYATFTIPLGRDPQTIFKALPKDIRYMIRKGEKAGLRVRRGFDQLEALYHLFALNMQRHGTPVFPRRYFHKLLEEFPGQIDLMLVYADSRPVAGAMSFLFRDTMQPYYVGATADAGTLAANDFMWWQMIKYAAETGRRCFDFGRSKKNTGSFAFKMKWNPQVEALDYQVYLVRRKDPPNFSPTNPKFEKAIRAWRMLPLGLTQWIGPHLVRWFP